MVEENEMKKVGPFVVEGIAENEVPAPARQSRFAKLVKRRGWNAQEGRAKPAPAVASPEDDAPQSSIVPRASVASTALTLVVAIMTFLASATLGAVMLIAGQASDWTSDIAREVTVQVAPVEGRDMGADVLAARQIAGATPGITAIRVLDDAQVANLLEPWLGAGLEEALSGDAADLLPVPKMMTLTLDRANPPDLAGLQTRLLEALPNAVLDDHRAWVGRLASMAGAMIAVGLVILLLVVGATVLITVFATRGAMAGNAHVIEVLHFVGAEPPYIAGQFQKHFLLLGLRGALAGGAAAIVSFIVLGLWTGVSVGDPAAEQVRALFGTFSVGPFGYLGVVVLAFAVALLTAFTSRYTVMRHVGGLDISGRRDAD